MARLFNRNLILLFQGQSISLVGTAVSEIAFAFWVLDATGSATLMGTVWMAASLPIVFLGPLVSALKARLHRGRVLLREQLQDYVQAPK